MGFDLGDYVDVASRIAEFAAKHPDGRLRPADPTKPYDLIEVDGKRFVVYVAAAYRTADDPLPGIGCAWEPFPGTTTYTRNSELQNVETSAWGRAIVAALIADTKKGVATGEDVRNRDAETVPAPRPATKPKKAPSPPATENPAMTPGHLLAAAAKKAGFTAPAGADEQTKTDIDEGRRDVLFAVTGKRSSAELNPAQIKAALEAFEQISLKMASLAYAADGTPYLADEPF